MGRIIRDFGGEGCARIAQPSRAGAQLPPETEKIRQEAKARAEKLRAMARPAIEDREQSDTTIVPAMPDTQ